jgi:hypothetical protein
MILGKYFLLLNKKKNIVIKKKQIYIQIQNKKKNK